MASITGIDIGGGAPVEAPDMVTVEDGERGSGASGVVSSGKRKCTEPEGLLRSGADVLKDFRAERKDVVISLDTC